MKMNHYCRGILHQIEVAISSILEIIGQLDKHDLDYRPTDEKYSIGELLSHISVLCKADYFISNGMSKEEMSHFYETNTPKTLADIRSELLTNFAYLKDEVMNLDECELFKEKTSYWGVTYSRYEWLLEILAHLYHHRGQLHAILVHCRQKNLTVELFE